MNKKNNNVTAPIYIPLPDDFHTSNQSLMQTLNAFSKCESLAEQQKILKSLPQYVKTGEDGTCVAQLLTAIFFAIEPKYPLKKTVTRLLLGLPEELTISAMGVHIIHLITACRAVNKMRKLGQENDVLISLNTCFNLFSPGVEAFSKFIDFIFIFSCNTFLKSIEYLYLNNENDKKILHTYIYNSSKFLVSLLSQCDISQHMPKLCYKLLVSSSKIITDEQIPFNTKSNCGILLIMAAVHSPEKENEKGITSLNTLICMGNGENENGLLTKLNYTAKICVFSGIINTFPAEVICAELVDDIPAPIYIFQNLLESATKRTGKPLEIMEISRTFISLSRLLFNMNVCDIEVIFKQAMDYIWTHLDHFIDTVRHDTIIVLKNFVKIAWLHHLKGNDSLMEHILNHVSDLIEDGNASFKALNVIANGTSCIYLLKHFPHMPLKLIENLRSVSIAQHVCTAYEQLMEQHSKEEAHTWLEAWVHPLIPLVRKSDPNAQHYYQKIFTNAFKLDKVVLELLSSNMKNTLKNANELAVVLSCFTFAKKYKFYNYNNLNGLLDHSILSTFICHHKPEIRLLTLTLVVDSQKTTEIFNEWDLNFLIDFLHYNITNEAANFRQNMIALYKKAFTRYKDSLYVIMRNLKGLRGKVETLVDVDGAKQMENQISLYEKEKSYYERFVKDLYNTEFNWGIYEGSNYPRKCVCLELLLALKQCVDTRIFNDLWDKISVSCLYEVLKDTYESNIIMATKLLSELPNNIVYYHTRKEFRNEFKNCMQMASSIKPNVTTTAAYTFQVLKQSPLAMETIKSLYNKKDNVTNITLLLIYYFLKEIENGLDMAKENVLVAFKHAPVYGLIFCIRHLIQKEHIDEEFPEIVPEIVDLFVKVSEIGMPIVNAASPEGYMPTDDECLDENVTSQMILVYAWRTIKEISLLLGELNIKHPSVETETRIRNEISKYFLSLFFEAKHRGAYEQAFLGFSKYCTKLWQGGSNFEHLPPEWLNNIFEAICSNDEKVIATRRSAGLPFMVQAIIITEPSARNHETFHLAMNTLLRIAEDYSTDNEKPAMHSMNILRALYKHNNLGELVTGYVVRGVIIAIIRFNHHIWGIRNSATLMFSALMMRMFGVQRTKDTEDVSIKNRLPAKVFFMRYQGMYDFILNSLKEFTTNEINNGSLYPILLILSRLYPSKEKTDMLQYLPYIINCLSSSIHKIRELAAHATISVITTESYSKHINGILEMISTKLPENLLHGQLMQLQLLMKNVSTKTCEIDVSLLEKSYWIITNAGRDISHASSALYMDFIILLILRFPKECHGNQIFAKLLTNLLDSFADGKRLNRTTSLVSFELTKLSLALQLYANCDGHGAASAAANGLVGSVNAVLVMALSAHQEVQMYALNCIYYVLAFLHSERLENVLDNSDLEYRFVNSLCKRTRALLARELYIHLSACDLFENLFVVMQTKEQEFIHKVLLILKHLPLVIEKVRPANMPVLLDKQLILDFFIVEAARWNSDIFATTLSVISVLIASGKHEMVYTNLIEDLLKPYSTSERDFTERLAVATFLQENPDFFYDRNILNMKDIVSSWYMAISLLQDNDVEVREEISKVTVSLRYLISTNCTRLGLYVVPEKSLQVLLTHMPDIIPFQEALRVYMYLGLKIISKGKSPKDVNEFEVFDKGDSNSYEEIDFMSLMAIRCLKKCLWKLDYDLSYKDQSIFIEEHTLLVATRFRNLLIGNFLCDPNKEKYHSMFVIEEMITYIENQPIGTKKFFAELKKILRRKFSKASSSLFKFSNIDYLLEYILLSPQTI